MDLRPALMPPLLDEAQVARLADLARRMDHGDEPPSVLRAVLDEFNREAGTNLTLDAFPGIHGATTHDQYVRSLLSAGTARAVPDITYEELLEVTTRVCGHLGDEHEIEFWMALLQKNLPDPRLHDLIYQPDEYFGDDHDRDLSPREILDTALAAPRTRFVLPPRSDEAAD